MPETSSDRSEAEQALEKAGETGERVEVVGQQSKDTTVYANPDGSTFTLEQSAVPVRAATADGGWQTPDATLVRQADGRVAPKAAAVAMEFSGGGSDDPLVRIDKDGRSLALGWPGRLPEPELDGTSALYRGVLDDVDLKVTASTEGFQHVLIVKTPQAAAQPELQQVEYSLKASGLSVVENNSGGYNAVDEDGNWVFRAPRAHMWDSTGTGGTTQASGKTARAAASVAASAQEAGDGGSGSEPAPGATVKAMQVSADQDSLTVKPDADMLTGTEAEHFPLYIDPSVSWGEAERTLLRSDGYESYGWGNGDDDLGKGIGKCGTWGGYHCGPGYTQRLYFEFAPDKLKGKRVLDATFRVTEPWAFQCSPRWIQLYRTNNISSSTTWASRPTHLDLVGDRNVSAGRGSSCDPDTPAAPIEFNDDPSESYENLTPTVKNFADGKFSRLTLMLKAKDETDASAWKRFRNDAVLAVTYVGLPAVPTSPSIASSCETNASDPAWVSDPTPRFSAKVQAASGGESGASLRAHFYVQQKTSSGWTVVATEPVRPSSGYVGDNATVSLDSPITLAQNTPYRMAVFTRSYYNSGANSIESNSTVTTKGWCYFTIDSTRPKMPTVTAPAGAVYTVCPADSDGCGAATGGPGTAGQFTFTKNSADANIVAFEYKLATDKSWTKVSATSSVTRSIKPALSGVQVLYVRAVDSVGSGQSGETTAIRFNVAEGEGPSGLWHFDDAAPDSGSTTAADKGTAPGSRHNLTLHESGAGWSTFSRTGEGGRSLWLNDTASTSSQTGYAEASGPVVNTQSSFTVSAWAYPTDDGSFRTVLSQTGSDSKGISLYYSPGIGRWVFLMHWYENGTRKYIGANADATPGITLKAWTHLAGVYDGEAHTLSLFVNGKRQGDPVLVPEAGRATAVDGKFQIGRAGTTSGAFNNYWKGRVDEVAAYQTVLPDAEVAKVAKLLNADETARAVELVAAWQPQGSTGTAALTDTVSGYGRSLQLSGGASVTDDAIVLDDAGSSVTTPGPVVDDRESFTVTTEVELDTKALGTKPDGYTAQVLGQRTADGSAWGLWYQRTGIEEYIDEESGELSNRPVGYWRFGRLNSDGSFTAVESDEAAASGAVRLTGVYDAQEGTIRLYLASTRNGVDTAYTAAIGSGEFAGGKGFVNKAWSHYLPGKITDIRIWVGAAEENQVGPLVGAAQDDEGDDVSG
ncbi:LamG-like jellyroll fold domain-containing protein [Streptomyces minutiscleroticus]|uniref:LamG-like jellyroll fold domain-containing protein n=1 Tax=Streptomyces minutiscleroticus TaxID=68238 RepID=UPI001E4B8379|nr:LamG-like jellyroll fold domain-containing protein [Streptomyces minutiscleroticus]